MHELCTLFDVTYLARGLALYRSLERVSAPFRLHVFCMDAPAKALLDRMQLPHMVTIGIDELERFDPQLLAIKAARTVAEYCWTATPAVCLFVLDRHPDIERITYLDADLLFSGDPSVLFEECPAASVLIVPARYPPGREEWQAQFGTYAVQFNAFRNDARGLLALRWWRDRCLEGCSSLSAEYWFGDQKYLDDWTERFEGVHAVRHVGAGVGPWNAPQYRFTRAGNRVLVDGEPLIFYHHQSLEMCVLTRTARWIGVPRGSHSMTRGPLPLAWGFGDATQYVAAADERTLVWEPYLLHIASAIGEIRAFDPAFAGGLATMRHMRVRAARLALPAPVRSTLARVRQRLLRAGPVAARR